MHHVIPIPAFQDNYIWAIISPDEKHCVVVDPGDPAPVHDFLQETGYQLTDVLVTHHHGDHSGGVLELHEKYRAKIYGPRNETIPHCDVLVGEGDIVTLSAIDAQFEVIDIPAHTRGHIAFVGGKMLFCGDTLFAAGCGRLFEGTAAQMHTALSKLAKLPGETKVYCGHEYTFRNLQFAQQIEPDNTDITARLAEVEQQQVTLPSTIELERRTNPFMRCDEPTVIQAAEQYTGRTLHSPSDVLEAIRDWKNSVH